MARRKKEVYKRKHGDPVGFYFAATDEWRTTFFGSMTREEFLAKSEPERDATFVRCKMADELNVIEIKATHATCVMAHVFLGTTSSDHPFREDAKARVQEITSRGNVAIVDFLKSEVREVPLRRLGEL